MDVYDPGEDYYLGQRVRWNNGVKDVPVVCMQSATIGSIPTAGGTMDWAVCTDGNPMLFGYSISDMGNITLSSIDAQNVVQIVDGSLFIQNNKSVSINYKLDTVYLSCINNNRVHFTGALVSHNSITYRYCENIRHDAAVTAYNTMTLVSVNAGCFRSSVTVNTWQLSLYAISVINKSDISFYERLTLTGMNSSGSIGIYVDYASKCTLSGDISTISNYTYAVEVYGKGCEFHNYSTTFNSITNTYCYYIAQSGKLFLGKNTTTNRNGKPDSIHSSAVVIDYKKLDSLGILGFLS
jgi:hypothetical protein